MSTKNEVFEYLIDQLRQQVGSNPYKQQCEDLAHEVQSLKNQLRDASAQIKELHLALVKATGDMEAYKLIRKGDTPGCKHNWLRSKHRTGFFFSNCGARKEDAQVEKSWVEHDGAAACPVPDDTVVDIKFRNGEVESNTKALWWRWSWGPSKVEYDIVAYRVVKLGRGPEQSGCCKEDTQECHHNWRFVNGKAPAVCVNCGVTKSSECEHDWQFYGAGFSSICIKCGLKK